jgi:hypothetical protein
MIVIGGFGYDLWMVGQVLITLILYKKYKVQIGKMSSLNTLVLSPIAPIAALVLFVMTRVKNKNYFRGYIFLPMLLILVLMMKDMGPTILVFSIVITCLSYTIYEINRLEQETNVIVRILKGCRPIAFSLVIGWMCKGMDNPISFIICCNVFSDYIVRMYSTTNKWKWNKEGEDSENGRLYNLLAGFMEAALIGAPSDLVSRSKPIVDGLADALCIANLLVNGSQRGSATVVVTNLPTALIFAGLLILLYNYGNLPTIKEEDKKWPATFNTEVPKISKLHLIIVVISLCYSYTLSSTDLVMALVLVSKVVAVTILCMFTRIKVATCTFFTVNMLF